MSDIISFKNNWKDAIITLSQLQLVWKQYSKPVQERLLSLLQKFEVAFVLKNEDRIVIPSMLSNAKPEDWAVFIYLNASNNLYRKPGRHILGMDRIS
jgi:hypothetical protein